MPVRPRLTPAVADCRRAVRESIARLAPVPGSLLLVALSGGPDSLALAAAAAFEAPRAGLRAGAVIVDHGLQEGSAAVAARAAEQATLLGLDPVLVRRVEVGAEGGPENAARDARRRAYADALAATGAVRILLGHTLDDQAETVLLGLGRGSGPDALAGMREDARPLLRPLLEVRRATTIAACADAGLDPWLDPWNDDPRYTRVRVRTRALPALEAAVGPGAAEALARTATQLREDSAALDAMAEEWLTEIVEHAEAGIALTVAGLASNPPALRQRIIRLAVEAEFGTTLSRAHTLAAAALVTGWHGQDALHLPGLRVERAAGRIVLTAIREVE